MIIGSSEKILMNCRNRLYKYWDGENIDIKAEYEYGIWRVSLHRVSEPYEFSAESNTLIDAAKKLKRLLDIKLFYGAKT